MLLQTIWQSNSDEVKSEIVTFPINDFFRIGDRQQIYPNLLWLDGKTFIVGDKGNGFNNEIQAFQYDHNFDEFYYLRVGNGSDTSDEFNHPVPFIIEENNFIYIGQTNTHNSPIDLYKSNAINTLKQGITKISQITGTIAYPQVFKNKFGNISIALRSFITSGEFNIALMNSDGGIEGTYTEVIITDEQGATYRIYQDSPLLYGTQTKHYLVGARRNDTPSPERYFAHFVVITDDFINFSNPTDTFSKDVTVSRITDTEADDNYTINGSLADDMQNLGHMNCIQINDVFYGITVKAGTTDLYIFKIENNVLTITLVNITNIFFNFFNPFLYYNGQNIIISCYVNDGGNARKELWATPLDLSSFTQKFVFDMGTNFGDKAILLPDNFDKVNGEYLAFLVGDSVLDTGTFLRTSDKFYI